MEVHGVRGRCKKVHEGSCRYMEMEVIGGEWRCMLEVHCALRCIELH